MKSVDSSLPVQTENKLGTEKISRLMLTTGVPLMLSLLINSLYNFVDSIFVSRVADESRRIGIWTTEEQNIVRN